MALNKEHQYFMQINEQKEQELIGQIMNMETEIKHLRTELERVDTLFKQSSIELQLLNERKEDLRMIDDFTLKEK